jgi:hypothetical protein
MLSQTIECKLIDLPEQTAEQKQMRTFSREFAETLASSIELEGLTHPITLRPHTDPAKAGRYLLVAGRHCLYATHKCLKVRHTQYATKYPERVGSKAGPLARSQQVAGRRVAEAADGLKPTFGLSPAPAAQKV